MRQLNESMLILVEETMNSHASDSDTSAEDHVPYRVLEKRIMISVALLGSFLFGFIFFGHAPSILGLLVFLGPIQEANVAPKLLGLGGILCLCLAFRWRRTDSWLPATTIGAGSVLASWWLFFSLVNYHFITFLGTFPFLFFVGWFLFHLVQTTGVFEKLNRRFPDEGEENISLAGRIPVRADFLSSVVQPLRRWIGGKEEERGQRVEDAV